MNFPSERRAYENDENTIVVASRNNVKYTYVTQCAAVIAPVRLISVPPQITESLYFKPI